MSSKEIPACRYITEGRWATAPALHLLQPHSSDELEAKSTAIWSSHAGISSDGSSSSEKLVRKSWLPFQIRDPCVGQILRCRVIYMYISILWTPEQYVIGSDVLTMTCDFLLMYKTEPSRAGHPYMISTFSLYAFVWMYHFFFCLNLNYKNDETGLTYDITNWLIPI